MARTAAALSEVDTVSKALVQRARNDPLWFHKTILNSDEHDPWQEELHEAVADIYRHKHGLKTRYNHEGLNQITIRAMHGPGKTYGVAGIMHWFNFCFYGTIVCTAPKEMQLRTRLWPAFRKNMRNASDAYRSMINVDSTKIVWFGDEDWVAHAETASEPENLAGYHADYLLFIVDEASGIKEVMFPVIEGAASTGKLVIVILIGNPTKNIGTFYDSHMKEKVAKNYYQIHVDLTKTSRVDKAWVQRQIDKYGKDSPVVQIRCFGNFANTDENQIIALEWLSNARERNTDHDGSNPKLRITVDVADGGEDETVITAALHFQSFVLGLKQESFSFPTAEAPILSAQAAARMFDGYQGDPGNGDDIVVDGLGVGAGCAGYLITGVPQNDGTLKQYPTINYKGGESSDNPAVWRCRRVQSYLVGRDDLMHGRVAFADGFLENEEDWDEFDAQMCSVRRRILGSDAKEDLETKENMKRRGLKSPDRADSWMMQYATQTPTLKGAMDAPIVVGALQSDEYDGGLV